MRINIDGGFIEAKKDNNTSKIKLSVGCMHYNPDGTRKETVINSADLTEEELVRLFSDVFPKQDVENEDSKDSEEKASKAE